MGRKSKYSAEEKFLILNEVLRNGIHKVIIKYKISQKTIRWWSLLYKYQGMPGIQASQHNQSYSKEFKNSLVEQYQQTDEALDLWLVSKVSQKR